MSVSIAYTSHVTSSSHHGTNLCGHTRSSYRSDICILITITVLCHQVRLAERSKALASGASLHLKAWVRTPQRTRFQDPYKKKRRRKKEKQGKKKFHGRKFDMSFNQAQHGVLRNQAVILAFLFFPKSHFSSHDSMLKICQNNTITFVETSQPKLQPPGIEPGTSAV